MTRIIPLRPYVVIHRDPAPEASKQGIHLPASAVSKPNTGRVWAVWEADVTDYVEENKGRPGVNEVMGLRPITRREKCTRVKVGDHVMFPEYAGTDVLLDDKPYLLMEEQDIQCIFEEADAPSER